jgi:hypothetical protein
VVIQRRIRQNAVTALGHMISWFAEFTYTGLILSFRFALDESTNLQGRDSRLHITEKCSEELCHQRHLYTGINDYGKLE